MFIKKGKVAFREYQNSIFESAKDKNTLVVLPTGLGKTVISALVIDYRLEKFPGSKALFLAPTKPLINQHRRTFDHISELSGDVVSGTVSKENRKRIYETSQIIFATPQTIENDMEKKVIDLREFSVIVIDEAHHAVGNYAYVKIVSEYVYRAGNPLILGLTASPASDSDKIRQICNNLRISNVEIRSDEDIDVRPYIKSKMIEEVRVDVSESLKNLISSLDAVIKSNIDDLQKAGFYKDTPRNRITRVSVLMLQKSLQKQMISGKRSFYTIRGIILASKLMKLYHAYNLLSTQSVESFVNFTAKIMEGKTKSDKEIASNSGFLKVCEDAENMLKNGDEHPKLGKLREILEKEFDKEQKAIIFTQYRDTVDVIYNAIKGVKGVNAVKFVGQGKGGLSQKEQVNIIKDFEAGVYNVLVSTSVSEEGMSIKGVDVAVFYETVPSAIRSIQRRGRVGRFDAGRIFILITKDTSDEGYYWVSKRKESKMKKIIKNIKENPETLRNDGTLNFFINR